MQKNTIENVTLKAIEAVDDLYIVKEAIKAIYNAVLDAEKKRRMALESPDDLVRLRVLIERSFVP